MISKVKDNLTEYGMIKPGDTVIAGISGGADSVCMYLQLVEYKKYVEYELKVVHVNHLIREDAPKDADFVKKLCERDGTEYFYFEDQVEAIAKNNGLSCEEAGRIVRYTHFHEIAGDTGKIAVAHNQNDVAETVLFNIFRGTGIEGLSSLEPVNGQIIRPLINLSRFEIEEYLKSQKQNYCIDCTNSTDDYSRNKIRNNILPYAEENIVNNAIRHTAELSQKMLKIKQFLKTESKKVFDESVVITEGEAKVDIDVLKNKDEVLIEEVLLEVIENLTPHRKDITSAHIEAIKTIIYKDGEKRVSLPYNLEAVKSYSNLYIRVIKEKNSKIEPLKIEEGIVNLPNNKVLHVQIFRRDESVSIPQKSYTKWFDYDKIINCVTLRNRQAKDYLTINEAMSKKLLKDYMIDVKIPKEDRDAILVLADDSHIMWVVGYRISEYYKVTEKTKNILEITIE